MNKELFLNELRKKLKSLPAKEQRELIQDYEEHFMIGAEQGKTEAELIIELGTPEQLAAEAINEYNRSYPMKKISQSSRGSRTAFSIVGLFVLNFIFAAVPLLLSIWAAWLGLMISFSVMIFTPLLAVLDFIWQNSFNDTKLFLSFIISGVSIFCAYGMFRLGMLLKRCSIGYYKWNVKIIKGAD